MLINTGYAKSPLPHNLASYIVNLVTRPHLVRLRAINLLGNLAKIVNKVSVYSLK